jgi:AraC-like DNA-binding protein
VGRRRSNTRKFGWPSDAHRIIYDPRYVFSEGEMALLAALTHDRSLELRLSDVLEPRHSIAPAHSWGGLERMVRERPVTTTIIDLSAVDPRPSCEAALTGLRTLFPHLGLLLVVRRHRDPFTLFRLGRAGIRNLVLLAVEDLNRELSRGLARAGEGGAASLVTRFLSPYLPGREMEVVYLAMDSIHRRWSAEALAGEVGLSRPFLSECLKAHGLPSLGHFLLWARLFHAGHWLEEPGRTGESVSRQLEYSSGSAFRRALRNYTGATPTEVAEGGGLSLVLRAFLSQRGLSAPRSRFRVSVA